MERRGFLRGVLGGLAALVVGPPVVHEAAAVVEALAPAVPMAAAVTPAVTAGSALAVGDLVALVQGKLVSARTAEKMFFGGDYLGVWMGDGRVAVDGSIPGFSGIRVLDNFTADGRIMVVEHKFCADKAYGVAIGPPVDPVDRVGIRYRDE